MDFALSEQEKHFRDNLRPWLQKHLSPGWGKTAVEPVDLHAKIAFLQDWLRQIIGARVLGLPRGQGAALGRA